MTNLEKWRYYFKDAPCPATWIDLGWYFCVTSALQRRVWYGNLQHRPLFPNMYVVLIGPPALGKNLVIMPSAQMIRFWPANPDDKRDSITGVEIKRLIETGPDSITFEKLVSRLAKATRRFTYTDEQGRDRAYSHASMCVILEELNAMFTRHNERIPKLFLKTYDCGDYEYDTKHQGQDMVSKCCMNMLAGATYSILKESEKYHIFDDGFVSRTLFSFETQPRHDKFHIGEITDHQITVFEELAGHIKRLTGVFGQLTYDQETYDYLEDWAQNKFTIERAGATAKMQTYYGRKKVTILKLAAAMHLSENLDLKIPLSAYQKAIEFLAPIEQRMKIGFGMVGRNALNPIAQDILRHLKRCPDGDTQAGLLAAFMMDVTYEELTSLVQTLQMSENITCRGGRFYAA